jgi:predicted AAA+ superfamily ATPase
MPRIDLVLSLIRAASQSDANGVRAAADAMASEESQHGHERVADRIRQALVPRAASSHLGKLSETSDHIGSLFFEFSPKAGLDSLALDEKVRLDLISLVREQQSAEKLRSAGLAPRHKVLLSGPPGNGKTSVAEALAYELGYPFKVVSYGALVGSLLGETNRRIESLFKEVKRQPCVLFFDEFEAVGKERGDRQEAGEMKRALASLLTQIDSLPAHVVVVAATNHPEMLDRAVWRRFEIKLILHPPNYSRIIGYLVDQLGLKADITLIQALGQCFPEKSYAELRDFTLDVRRRAVLDLIDIHEALRQEIASRFPDIDWPYDVRPEQTSSQIRPASYRGEEGRKATRSKAPKKVRKDRPAKKVSKPI